MSLLGELRALFEPILADYEPDAVRRANLLGLIRPAGASSQGDYQANFAMPLAKQLGRKAPELAAEIVAKLPAGGCVERATTAGPGFIDLHLSTAALAERLRAVAADPRLGVKPAAKPQALVVDYSGPNVAKPLHVGHLRSTIIGDSLVRILKALGHTVIGDNHLGDWGTQFGILLYGYKNLRDEAAYQTDPVRELARLYVAVRKQFRVSTGEDDELVGDDPVKEACRLETAKLHQGDTENVKLWNEFMPVCLEMLRPIYERLDVSIDHALGESFYNPMLPGVVDDLLARGLAFESDGAVVIPNAAGQVPGADDLKTMDPPALIRKRDGAFTYTTTDLATIRYRAETFQLARILYVVDARQSLHFKTLFAAATRWDYAYIDFRHVAFGSILGEDRKPLRTRDGGVPELETLLNEAVAAAAQGYTDSRAERQAAGHEVPEMTPAEQAQMAEVVGIGAMKYADLSGNRTSDYVFNLNKMLAKDGNTATYMQYAYARSQAIFRKGAVAREPFRTGATPIVISDPAERTLAISLLRYPDVVESAALELAPHILTGYLWDTARAFNTFFEKCPVLMAETLELKLSRLQLVDLSGRAIQSALGLLGIGTVEQM